METIAQLWETTYITVEALGALAGLVVFALLLSLLTLRARRRGPFIVRPLPAAQQIHGAVAQAMETGEPLHIALGTGGLGDLSTADTLAGIDLISRVAHRAALAGVPVRVRTADPTALAGALAALQHGALSAGYPESHETMEAEYVAPTPLAYAAGVAEAVRQEPMAGNTMVGQFGPELLLPAEAGVRRGLCQMGGTSTAPVLPLLAASVSTPILGEELYALGAALGRSEHTAGLVAQDVFRALIALGILFVTVAGLLGLY